MTRFRQFWAATSTLSPAVAAWWQLRLLTAQRGGELARLRWADIADGGDALPAAHAKNKKAHRVPLGAGALAILDTLRATAPAGEPGRRFEGGCPTRTDRTAGSSLGLFPRWAAPPICFCPARNAASGGSYAETAPTVRSPA